MKVAIIYNKDQTGVINLRYAEQGDIQSQDC